MKISEFLNNVCNQIKYKPIRSEISEELESHIKDLEENYIRNGMNENEAEEKAILQMGNANEIGKNLNKIHKPKFNFPLLILVLALLAFSVLVNHLDYTNNSDLNFITIILSIIPFLLIYFFDYRKLIKYSNLIYAISTIMLLYSMISGVRNALYK